MGLEERARAELPRRRLGWLALIEAEQADERERRLRRGGFIASGDRGVDRSFECRDRWIELGCVPTRDAEQPQCARLERTEPEHLGLRDHRLDLGERLFVFSGVIEYARLGEHTARRLDRTAQRRIVRRP